MNSREELRLLKQLIEEVELNQENHPAAENIYLLLIASRLMLCRLIMLNKSKSREIEIVGNGGILTRSNIEARMHTRFQNLKKMLEAYASDADSGVPISD